MSGLGRAITWRLIWIGDRHWSKPIPEEDYVVFARFSVKCYFGTTKGDALERASVISADGQGDTAELRTSCAT